MENQDHVIQEYLLHNFKNMRNDTVPRNTALENQIMFFSGLELTHELLPMSHKSYKLNDINELSKRQNDHLGYDISDLKIYWPIICTDDSTLNKFCKDNIFVTHDAESFPAKEPISGNLHPNETYSEFFPNSNQNCNFKIIVKYYANCKIILPLYERSFFEKCIKNRWNTRFAIPPHNFSDFFNAKFVELAKTIIITDSAELAFWNQENLKKNYNKSIAWISWMDFSHKPLSELPWLTLQDKHIYYLVSQHSARDLSQSFDDAFKVSKELSNIRVASFSFVSMLPREMLPLQYLWRKIPPKVLNIDDFKTFTTDLLNEKKLKAAPLTGRNNSRKTRQRMIMSPLLRTGTFHIFQGDRFINKKFILRVIFSIRHQDDLMKGWSCKDESPCNIIYAYDLADENNVNIEINLIEGKNIKDIQWQKSCNMFNNRSIDVIPLETNTNLELLTHTIIESINKTNNDTTPILALDSILFNTRDTSFHYLNDLADAMLKKEGILLVVDTKSTHSTRIEDNLHRLNSIITLNRYAINDGKDYINLHIRSNMHKATSQSIALNNLYDTADLCSVTSLENHPKNQKLNTETRNEIIKIYRSQSPHPTKKRLADEFGISIASISRILKENNLVKASSGGKKRGKKVKIPSAYANINFKDAILPPLPPPPIKLTALQQENLNRYSPTAPSPAPAEQNRTEQKSDGTKSD